MTAPPVTARGWPAGCGVPALAPGDAVHLVGLGGAGMQAVATLLLARGLAVSGSDRADGAALHRLAAAGAAVHVGHAAAQLPAGARLVAVTAALPAGNPEVEAAHAAGVPVVKVKQLLGALVDAGRGVGVAGTHGKTTTTGLLGHAVRRAGVDATVVVGGDVPDLGGSAVAGAADVVVYEADEYDRSFLFGRPSVAVITNVEHDHPDIYPTLADVVDAFGAFARAVRPDGVIVACADSPQLRGAVAGAAAAITWYGVADAPGGREGVDWLAVPAEPVPDGQAFDVFHAGRSLGRCTTRLAGIHNVANALAVIAAADALGLDAAAVRAAVADYRGVGRRFEVVGEAAGVTVIDDYAHHPTEIAATIAAARAHFPGRRVWAIWQPHTFSRVALLADGFAASLAAADRVVVTPVYGAREAGDADAGARIAAAVPGAAAHDLDGAAAAVAGEAAAGDVALFMGAGDLPRASRAAVRGLARRAAAAVAEAGRAAGLGGDVLGAAALSEHTSLRVGGPADLAVRARRVDDLAGWWLLSWRLGAPVRALGRGTNVLVADHGLPGVVLINRCEAWQVVADDGRCERGAVDGPPPAADAATARVVAESGVTLTALARQLARQGWAGLEAAVGIPGSVGAGVVTNAGAHGWAMADSVVWAEVLERGGARARWDADRLGFGYRHSALKHDATRLVCRAVLRVRRDDPEAILARIAGHTAHRRRTQPTTPSVGSVFKNPPGDAAGRLIEAAGLKGRAEGGARISPVHANFFVNEGGARAADIRALIDTARAAVQAGAGVRLELEIEPLGDDDEPAL